MSSLRASVLEQQRAVLEAIEELESEKAVLHGRSLALRAELAQLWSGERDGFAQMELAGTALVGQFRAARELDDACRTELFPRLTGLLADGAVFVPSAELLLSATARCTPEVQQLVDARLSAQLVGRNVTDCRRLIRSTVLAVEAELDPQLTADRLEAAKKNARVWIAPGDEGMTAIGTVLEAVAGRRWALDFEQLVKAQLTLDRREGRERTVPEVSAEVFASLPSLVLELVRAARDDRLSELADIDTDALEQLAELADLAAAVGEAAEEPAATEVRVEADPCDEARLAELVAADPTRDLPPCTVEPSEPEGPPPDVPAAQDAAPGDSFTAGTDSSSDLRLQLLLLRCLKMPLDSPTVLSLHLPMAAALDLTSAPGILEGHGPLGAERIRELLPSARLREVYVDEHTGVPLGAAKVQLARPGQADLADLLRRIRPVVLTDRAEPQHDPSAALAEFVKLRDQRCSGPGCTLPASRCHLDHEREFPDGPTAEWNLGDKSARCHGAKHHGWDAERHPDGTTDWTSPTGRVYTSHSQWLPPPKVVRPFGVTFHLPPSDTVVEIEMAP